MEKDFTVILKPSGYNDRIPVAVTAENLDNAIKQAKEALSKEHNYKKWDVLEVKTK